MQSTDVNRTLTSGYSELMGLYPPGTGGAKKLTNQELEQLKGVAKPPFVVRNAAQVNRSLGSSALPHDLTSIPIVTFIDGNLHDDLQYSGCHYIQDGNN